jgi:hypothetical protein
VFVRSRSDTALEVLALRQQVVVLKRKRPRPTLSRLDRFFWTTLRHLWPRWSDVLLIVKPETVVRWHRAGFRLYWRWRSRQRGGRPRISEEIRTLIRRLAAENADWGAPIAARRDWLPSRTEPRPAGAARRRMRGSRTISGDGWSRRPRYSDGGLAGRRHDCHVGHLGGWHRRLIAQQYDGSPRRGRGRPASCGRSER